LAYLCCIPNITVAAPSDELELRNMMYTALKSGTPFAIRYPRGAGRGVQWRNSSFEQLPIGRGRELRAGEDVAVIALGKCCDFALQAAQMAEAEGISVAVYDLRYAKPLDRELIENIGQRFNKIITVEDGVLRGGVGEAVTKIVTDSGSRAKITTLGIDDTFVEQGTPAELYNLCGYDAIGVLKAIKS
jgi:1-deoxy-D-xylulose-5-phosphate synthase